MIPAAISKKPRKTTDASDGTTLGRPSSQLNGFTYDRLGGIGGTTAGGTGGNGTDVEMLGRDISWYLGWLARDCSYTPQPYEQLAAAFRAAGEPTKANRVLYASRERERTKALERGHDPR